MSSSRNWCHMWVEFFVGLRPCSEGFLRLRGFSHGSFGFPAGPPVFLRVLRFSSLHKNEHSKFQLDMDGHSGQQEPPCGVSIAESFIIVIIFITITVIFITIVIVDCRLHRHCYGNGYGQCYRYSYHCCSSCRYNVNIIHVIVTYVIVSITKC